MLPFTVNQHSNVCNDRPKRSCYHFKSLMKKKLQYFLYEEKVCLGQFGRSIWPTRFREPSTSKGQWYLTFLMSRSMSALAAIQTKININFLCLFVPYGFLCWQLCCTAEEAKLGSWLQCLRSAIISEFVIHRPFLLKLWQVEHGDSGRFECQSFDPEPNSECTTETHNLAHLIMFADRIMWSSRHW